MKKKSFPFFLILLLSLSMILAACGETKESEGEKGGESNGGAKKPEFISIVTGGTGGTYFPLGGSFANIITDETGIKTNAETSGASAENMNTLKDGNAEIAFTQTDIASYAKDGKLMFEGAAVDNVSAIGTLYPETIQIVTTAKSGIKSVEDLKGKKVSVGAPGSGTAAMLSKFLRSTV